MEKERRPNKASQSVPVAGANRGFTPAPTEGCGLRTRGHQRGQMRVSVSGGGRM